VPYRCGETPPSQGEGDAPREDAAAPGEGKLRSEGLTYLAEDLFRVRTPSHQPNEIAELDAADLPLSASFLLVSTDLAVNDS
jgi:hypothetical protein